MEKAGEKEKGKEKAGEKEKGKEKVGEQHEGKTIVKKKVGGPVCSLQWRRIKAPRKDLAPSSSSDAEVSRRGRNLRHALKIPGVIEPTYSASRKEPRVNEDTYFTSSKKVKWADEGGLALTRITLVHTEDFDPPTRVRATSTNEDKRSSDTSDGQSTPSSSSGVKKSYKEALLTPISTPKLLPRRPKSAKSFPTSNSPANFSFKGRCYRCLGNNHWASSCRGPLRAMRARPSYLSAFVPQTEDLVSRQNQCRNAILVDVLPPKKLGHFPQETIANRMASRFGGFPSDFHVAKFSQRLRRASLTYNVWIRLVCLPYECWSSRTVAGLVGGFGRFIRGDDFSIRMVDLTGYRCLVAVNYLSDIPENLEVTVGDYSLSVLIQLERWGRRDVPAPANPPNERTDQHDPCRETPRRTTAQPDLSLGLLFIDASAGLGSPFSEDPLELNPIENMSSFSLSPELGGGDTVTDVSDTAHRPGEVEASPSTLIGSTRSSARLDSARKVSMLERAKLRKVKLLEGETSGATSLPCYWNCKKILKKGARCGVKLSGSKPRSYAISCCADDRQCALLCA
uniref:DUF4283 domain-containing protein n=1 Tax=Ananas comosus var. bracteatus TaxID=296719 RepID=A0A6V7NFZ4_ANACO|nr:unnamed protein product [Ananas comosus var. bracteatus]